MGEAGTGFGFCVLRYHRSKITTTNSNAKVESVFRVFIAEVLLQQDEGRANLPGSARSVFATSYGLYVMHSERLNVTSR
jgi:hypothetical protein